MIPVWKNIPFLRIIIPFSAGILAGWYFSLHWQIALIAAVVALPFFLYLQFSGERSRFYNSWLDGLSFNIIFISLGIALVWLQQKPHQPNWTGHFYKEGDAVQLRLLEPLSEREKTYKALSEITVVYHQQKARKVTGRAMIYFRKDSIAPSLQYGDVILVRSNLQEIKNAGNPGGFDYKRYALFNGITHQLFVKSNEYKKLPQQQTSLFYKKMYEFRSYILQTIRRYVKGDMESSIAEALLIGYRDDLDRDLVQAYSNTGVVHIIAVSGMHLGLIYGLLMFLLKGLNRNKRLKIIKAVLIITLLWLFSLLTGASASVLRAVLMFTAIVGAEVIDRKGTIYNSMAASAVVLLLFNPFLLWDVGFQLSYAAVLSIVLFMKSIYNWFAIQNKLLDGLWKLNALTLSAQILTLPLCMYHFHQAPTLFLITNLVAVPLSSLVLYALILLMVVSPFVALANAVGWLITKMLWLMNQFILWVDHFTFAVVDGIEHSPVQTILLYLIIAGLGIWLIQKKKAALKFTLFFIAVFFAVQFYYQYATSKQQKLVVYNLSQHTAIDFMLGKRYYFNGDSVLLQDGFLRNFHLKPSRIAHRTYEQPNINSNNAWTINNKTIIHINQSYRYDSTVKITADVVIVSNNPKLYLNQLQKTINCKLLVFDSSNPQWKLKYWKTDCEKLGIHYFCTSEQGAFVMNL
ncbi:ComEC/Rec2 family competence protein [Lacibacter sp. H375]|uniref:ComEC/Rec2 family competence protein n=1 Tax=Lacibacter sp. H375 TaxID=3133424 RepID=UPI0030BAB7C1